MSSKGQGHTWHGKCFSPSNTKRGWKMASEWGWGGVGERETENKCEQEGQPVVSLLQEWKINFFPPLQEKKKKKP